MTHYLIVLVHPDDMEDGEYELMYYDGYHIRFYVGDSFKESEFISDDSKLKDYLYQSYKEAYEVVKQLSHEQNLDIVNNFYIVREDESVDNFSAIRSKWIRTQRLKEHLD